MTKIFWWVDWQRPIIDREGYIERKREIYWEKERDTLSEREIYWEKERYIWDKERDIWEKERSIERKGERYV